MRASVTDISHELDGAILVYRIPCSIEADNESQCKQYLGGPNQGHHFRLSSITIDSWQNRGDQMVITADWQTVRNLRLLFKQGTLPIASIQLYVSTLAFYLDMKRKRSHDQVLFSLI